MGKPNRQRGDTYFLDEANCQRITGIIERYEPTLIYVMVIL
ncbi:hypothetical protein [Endozoicomonas sp. ALD040]